MQYDLEENKNSASEMQSWTFVMASISGCIRPKGNVKIYVSFSFQLIRIYILTRASK